MLLGVASVISRHHPARLQLFSSPCQLNQEALAWCSVTAADIEQPLRRHGECPAACGVCNWRTLGSCGYFAWQCHSRVLGLQLIPSPAQHSSQNKTYPAIWGGYALPWSDHVILSGSLNPPQMAWSLWVTMPSEGFTANPSDGRVTLLLKLKSQLHTLRWHGHSEWPDSEWAHQVKTNTKISQVFGNFLFPVRSLLSSPFGHSEWPDSEWAHQVKINTKISQVFGNFLFPVRSLLSSPFGHLEWPDSEWAHQVKINTKISQVFGNFLFTIRSPLYSPSGHSFIPRPVTHFILRPVTHFIPRPVTPLFSVRSLIYSPSGHSFHSPSGHSFIPRPVTHLFPVRSLIYSPSGHSFHSPSGRSFQSLSSHSERLP